MRPFQRNADGAVEASFTALEVELLNDLATQVIELLDNELPTDRLLATVGIGGSDAPSPDPAIARLLPDAYRDDAASAQEFRRLTEHSLSGRKVSNARGLMRSLEEAGEVDLDAEAQQAWLRTLTDIRLVIASRLGIESDDDRGRHESDDDLMMRDIYDWLAMVQSSLIDALE